MKNMSEYRSILEKQTPSIVISGDSLSYNRYSYDPEFRGMDVWCYGPGLPSWSFQLRDRIYQEDPWFRFGDELRFSCPVAPGVDEPSQVPFLAAFGGRGVTLEVGEETEFTVPGNGAQVVLYLQKRPEDGCVLDIWVDGKPTARNVDIRGNRSVFHGFELVALNLNGEAGNGHRVSFRNIRGEHPRVTLAGTGSVYRKVALTGQGSTCVRFFIENFSQRIADHSPDLLILILTANDRIKVAPMGLYGDLQELFTRIQESLPETKVLFLLPPSSHDPEDPGRETGGYSSLLTIEAYNRITERACREFGIESLRTSELFDGDHPELWRMDNIHLNPEGNRILLDAMRSKLGLKKE